MPEKSPADADGTADMDDAATEDHGAHGEGVTPRRRRLTRAEARARTRQQLLDSAARVFAQKGFAGASVEEIAESAGYSTGALYFNFDGKEQLFLELLSARRSRGIERRAAAAGEILGGAAEGAGDDGAGGGDPFGALSGLFAKVAGRSGETVALQAEFWLYAVRNPEAMDIVAAKTREQVEALEPLVATAMKRSGVASDVSARAVTRVALALFQGLVRQRRIDPAAVPDDLFPTALRWLFAGLRQVTNDRG
jgi:AcrR family transcriptional regulator